MKFIDQSPAYNQKAISLDRAIGSGRAQVHVAKGAEKLAICFRPELTKANAFDREINERVKFNDLPTADKLDLMTAELLPRIFHPEMLPLTGRSHWTVRFVIDGSVERLLLIDAQGVHAGADTARTADIEVETDVMTLMAILRSEIARFHMNPPPYPDLAGEAATDGSAPS